MTWYPKRDTTGFRRAWPCTPRTSTHSSPRPFACCFPWPSAKPWGQRMTGRRGRPGQLGAGPSSRRPQAARRADASPSSASVQSAGRCPGRRRFVVACPKARGCSCVRVPTPSATRSGRSAATAVWSHRSPALAGAWAWQRGGFFSRSALAPHLPRHGESQRARVGHAPAPHGDRPSGGGGPPYLWRLCSRGPWHGPPTLRPDEHARLQPWSPSSWCATTPCPVARRMPHPRGGNGGGGCRPGPRRCARGDGRGL